MKNIPPVSDEEIRQYMDFDSVLKQSVKLYSTKTRLLRNSIILGSGGLSLIALIVFLNNNQPAFDNKPSTISSVTHEELKTDTSESQIKPIIDSSSHVKIPALPQAVKPTAKKAEKEKTVTVDQTPSPLQVEIQSAKKEEAKIVYTQPRPLDGYPALYEYLNSNLVYPPDQVKDSIQGVTTVYFTIDTLGRASNVVIENSLGPAFDQETIRLIEAMPLWQPAMYKDKPVPSKVSLPLTFQITNQSK